MFFVDYDILRLDFNFRKFQVMFMLSLQVTTYKLLSNFINVVFINYESQALILIDIFQLTFLVKRASNTKPFQQILVQKNETILEIEVLDSQGMSRFQATC